MIRARTWLILAALLAPAARADDAADLVEPPPYDSFLVVPLRVHVLTADELPEIDCHLTEADIDRILGKVNGIWHRAGIHFARESLRREPAELGLWFLAFREQAAPSPLPLGLFALLAPAESRRFDGLHVYYIHRFSVNGVFLGDDLAFVQETAALRPVAGGIDEPIPRVTAHELGHALGLRHRQDRTNLLASGTTGTLLNRAEAERAQKVARTLRGVESVPDLIARAEKAEAYGDRETARRLWGWLAQVPGEGAGRARERLEALAGRPGS